MYYICYTVRVNETIARQIDQAKIILIIQADNPDGDSLGSALALEEILGDMGKEVHLYCGVDIPDYLKHFEGWDRASRDVPSKFDLSIIVDTSAITLLEKLEASRYRNWVAAHPVIVLDHHAEVECDISYATTVLNDKNAVATGELIYKLASDNKWPMNVGAKTHLASAILSDSLGLASEGTTALTYHIMGELIEGGVDRPALEEARRALNKMSAAIFRYKARLIERTELLCEGALALVVVPHEEIMEFSPLYNPAPLIQNDMLQTEGVRAAIVLKHYNDGKVTGSIRCNYGAGIAADLAQHFGGGGHAYAAGFKNQDGRSIADIKQDCIDTAISLLNASD